MIPEQGSGDVRSGRCVQTMKCMEVYEMYGINPLIVPPVCQACSEHFPGIHSCRPHNTMKQAFFASQFHR